MKSTTRKILCILCVIAAAVCVIFACFTLTRKKQSDEAAAASVSQFGAVADFDYETFDYSEGLDENGYWSGIKATDYVIAGRNRGHSLLPGYG